MAEPNTHPVVILGPHRSGTSAIAGCLSMWGLDLGESIPAGRDNPTGFFEDARVLAANKALLRSMGRDWTDPPPLIDRAVDVSGLAASIADRDRTNPWGFKDPRTVFLLPAWSRVLEGFKFVGVFRPAAAIAESLIRRNSLPDNVAKHLAHLYLARLALIRRQIAFPIIRFDQEHDLLVKRLAELATQLELQPDLEKIDDFLRPTLFEPVGDLSDDERYLSEAAAEPRPISVATSAMLKAATSPNGHSPPTYFGPAHQIRGRAAWGRARDLVATTGNVSYLPLGGGRPELPGAPAFQPTEDVARSHIIAPDLLDVTPPDKLRAVLQEHAEAVSEKAALALTGYVVDADFYPEALYFRLDVQLAQRAAQPYLHHLDQIQAATLDTDWTIARFEPLDGLGERSLVVFTNHPPERVQFRTRRGLLHGLAAAENDLEAIKRETARANEAIKRETARANEAAAQLTRLAKEREAWNERRAELTAELKQERTIASAAEKRYAATAAELRRLSEVASRYQSQYANATSQLQKARKTSAALENRYDRLRNRRSVRIALSIAGLGRPLFGVVRRLRARAGALP